MHLVVPTKSGLPAREHSFCHFLVADPSMDATAAMLKVKPELKHKAAYQAAGRILEKEEARVYIGSLLEERQKRLEMDEDWVVGRLRDVHDRCMQNEPVFGAGSQLMDAEGEPTGEVIPIYYKFDAAGAIKSLELIGKHMKMFSDKTASGSTTVSISINLGADTDGNEKPAIEGEFTRVGGH
jgi:phage terminase small subunit